MIANKGFEVSFRFEGRLADSGSLDGSDHEAATRAGRRLLALHAHAFLTGRVPRAAVSERGGYHIRHAGSRQGSHIDFWQVVVANPNPWLVAAGCFLGSAYQVEIKSAINAAASFCWQSIRAAVRTAFVDVPPLPRIEPTLVGFDANRMPLIDDEAENAPERYRFYETALGALIDLSRPVGRSADVLTILIDGKPVAVIDEATKRRMMDERQRLLDREIGDAVLALRSPWYGRQ